METKSRGRHRRRGESVWIGAEIVLYPSIANGERNWDVGGNKGIVATRSRVVRRFDSEAEAKAWFQANRYRSLVFPLREIKRSDRRRRLDELARMREAEYQITNQPRA